MNKMSFLNIWLVLIFTSLTLVPAQSFAQEASGVMMVVKGDIKVTSYKDGKTEAAKVGKKVFSGDSIVAAADSRAKIVMSDKNILNISPESKVVIEKYTNDPKSDSRSVELKVEYGKVRAQVEQKYDGEKNKFNIKTPTAVAGVRGTDFITGFNPQTRKSSIVTFTGMVAVGTPGPKGEILNAVFVRPGQTTSVGEGKTPEPPKPMPKDELQNMNQETAGSQNSGNRGSDSALDSGPGSNAGANDQNTKEDKPENKQLDKKNDNKNADRQSEPSTEPGKSEPNRQVENNKQNERPNEASTKGPNGPNTAGDKNQRDPASLPPQPSTANQANGPALPPPKFETYVPTNGPNGPMPPMFMPPPAPQLPPQNSFINETIRNGSGTTRTTVIINK